MKRQADVSIDSNAEGLGKMIPVKKAQVASLFQPLPTEVSVVDGYYQKHYRTQATFNPLQFFIPPSSNFLDLTQCTLELEVKLTKTNGTDLGATTNVGVINNVGHSLIKRFDVKLNDTATGEPTDLYMYKAYLFNLLNFSQDQKDTYLAQEGWFTDQAGERRMNNFQTEGTSSNANKPITSALANYNAGYMARTEMFFKDFCATGQTSKSVKFILHPCVDLFQAGRFLVPGVSLDIQVDFNDPDFVLMAADGDTSKFEIVDAVFNVRHVKLNPSAHLEVEKLQLEKQQTAIYPIRTSKPIRRTLQQGITVTSFTDVFQQSVPDVLTLALVKSANFNGAKNLNPYYFELFGLEDVRVLVNGMERPRARLELKGWDQMEGYETLFESTGNGHRGFTPGIKRDDYRQGFALLRFNLTPDGKDAKNYTYKKNEGTLDVFLKFKTALGENVTVLMFPEFENEILVDPNKVVVMAKNY
jgi:hypothetical protein